MTDTTNYNYAYPVEKPKEEICSTDSSYNKPGLPTPPAGWGKTTTPAPMPAEMC